MDVDGAVVEFAVMRGFVVGRFGFGLAKG